MPSQAFDQWFRGFSNSGRISPLSLGMSRSQIESEFGAPDDHSADRPVAKAAVWKYGELEFHFGKEDSLHLIYLDTPDAVVISIPRLARSME